MSGLRIKSKRPGKPLLFRKQLWLWSARIKMVSPARFSKSKVFDNG